MSFPYPIQGTILDSGSVAVVTKVILRNDRTGEKISTISNSSGQYVLDAGNLASGYMTSDRVTIVVSYGDEEGSSSILISSNTHTINITLSSIAESTDLTYCQVQDILDELGDKTTSDINYERVRKTVLRAEAEIEERSGTKFKSTTVTNEYHDFDQYTSWKGPEQLRGYATDMLVGSRNDYWNTVYNDRIRLKYTPVLTITALSKNNNGKNETDSWESLTQQTGSGGDFIVDLDTGIVTFVGNAPALGIRKVKVSYTYGFSSVPKTVERLAILLSIKSILTSKVNSSQFDSTDSISLEGISISKGTGGSVTYMDALNKEIKELWLIIGDMVNKAV